MMMRQVLSLSTPLAPTSKKKTSITLSSTRTSIKCSAFTSPCLASSSSDHDDDAVRFAEASKNGNLVPLHRCIFSDQLTPVLAYRCLVKEYDWESPSFLFESVEQGFQGRYSVVGAQPSMEIVAKENSVTIMDHEQGTRTVKEKVEDPMEIPRQIMQAWTPQLIHDLPDAFCGGWVGYFSYDTVRYVEKKRIPFSNAPKDDRNLPDIHIGLYDDVIVFDHVEKKAYVIHWVRLDRYSTIEKAYNDGKKQLDILVSRVQEIVPPRLAAGYVNLHTRHFGSSLKMSSMQSEAYKKAVIQAKEHILAGDIFQIVLSQRFERRTFADPFEVYRALRVVNPNSYMAYLQARGCILVASSPEILTRVKKVSKPSSVNVEKLMNIEQYSQSHVMHISSTVTRELLDDLTCWDALRAALPVGTVSGAPKVKAMELIDLLEITRRGPHSGGFGGVSFTGNMDIALALWTIVFPTFPRYDTMYSYKGMHMRREWVAHIQAGAGIVADSDPNDRQNECENKSAALACAIDLAELAFVEKR